MPALYGPLPFIDSKRLHTKPMRCPRSSYACCPRALLRMDALMPSFLSPYLSSIDTPLPPPAWPSALASLSPPPSSPPPLPPLLAVDTSTTIILALVAIGGERALEVVALEGGGSGGGAGGGGGRDEAKDQLRRGGVKPERV
jgi:hypothetical protein